MSPILILLAACAERTTDTGGKPASACDNLSWFADEDADGFGDPAAVIVACEAPVDAVSDNTDCDDADPGVHPGASETCDGRDEDCDEAVDEDAADAPTWYTDEDGDGYGDGVVVACAAPANGVADPGDCDDTNPTIHPGAAETPYDAVDQDCDGIDIVDVDGDGEPALAAGGADCDDANAAVHPGALETCDGVDQDCDGVVDDGEIVIYADSDGDGFGDAAVATSSACPSGTGWVADASDCDDTDASIHPGVAEIPYDAIDQDCDGADLVDTDGDGEAAMTAGGADCDDTSAGVHPGATETCDGVDDDCDGSVDDGEGVLHADSDGDGYGDTASTIASVCAAIDGYAVDGTDCDDADAAIHPGAAETPYDAIDQDCDGADVVDADGDGEAALAAGGADCDDGSAGVYPGAAEACDGLDQDCNGVADDGTVVLYADADADGFGDAAASFASACGLMAGYSPDASDCDDGDASISPAAPETPYDGVDQDCDGADVVDADGDGEAGVLGGGADCDDTDPEVHPGGTESCDGGDEDCNGLVDDGTVALYADADADGFGDPSAGVVSICGSMAGYTSDSDDCDDAHAEAFPGGSEVVDGLDNDCDGWTDPATASWDLADGVAREVNTVVVQGHLELGAAAADPGSLTVNGGLGGSAAVGSDGSFTLTMNQDSTGVVRVTDASGRLLALRVVPKSAALLPPGELAMTHEETVFALLFLTPGWAVSDPFVAGTLLGAMHEAADPAALATAAASLEAQLAADPGSLYAFDPNVVTAIDGIVSGIVAMAGTEGTATAPSEPASRWAHSTNGIFGADGATSDLATLALSELDPMAYTATLDVTNYGYRWLSLYADPDDTETDLLALGDSQWLGFVPARSFEIPDATALAYAILKFSGDLFLTSILDPDNADMVGIFQDHWAELVDEATGPEQRSIDLDGLEPIRTGRVFVAGPGKGTGGAEAGSRPAPAELLTFFTQVAVPAVSVWMDVDGLLDPIAYTKLTSCESVVLIAATYATEVEELVSEIANADYDEAFDHLITLVGEILGEDDLWECVDLRGIVTTDWMIEQLGEYAGAGWNPITWYNLGADALSFFGTFVGLTVTVADAPDGSSYDVSIVDRDGDGFVDWLVDGDDCDDTVAGINPGALEVWYDGVDADCSGGSDYDHDGDGDDSDGYTGGDCDDDDAGRSSLAAELCNEVDDDCDGSVDEGTTAAWFSDADGDGYGDPASPGAGCTAPAGAAGSGDDCDDSTPLAYPGATERCDGLDNDCDEVIDEAGAVDAPTWYADTDADGYGDAAEPSVACSAPAGFVAGSSDCDDEDPGVSPGEAEVCSNYVDDDCDGTDNGCALSGDASLSESSAKITGAAASDHAGYGVFFVGDTSGDGTTDVLVGASSADPGGSGTGAAYLFDSGVTGSHSVTERIAEFDGVSTSYMIGVRGCAGDWDDDGRSDIGLGDYAEDRNGTDSGVIWVFRPPFAGTYQVTDAPVVLLGDSRDKVSQCSSGDMDGDGDEDYLVGAYGHSSSRGGAYLVDGSVEGEVVISTVAAAVVTGESSSDQAGQIVSFAPDVDGDGQDDILLGAYKEDTGASDAGAGYLLYGPVTGSVSLSTADGKYYGVAADDRAFYVAPAGDLDNDGLGDVAVGAPWSDVGGTGAGAVYVFFGPAAGTHPLTEADVIVVGEYSADYAGQDLVGPAGDVNQDGVDDLVVPAEGRDSPSSSSGSVYLLYGPLAGTIDLSAADAEWKGESASDTAGRSIAVGGDLNGDGYPDLAVGAYGDDDAGSDAGAVYLLLGAGL